MIRVLLAFLFGLLLGACAATPAVAPRHPDRTADAITLEGKTVALLIGDTSLCSGVWVSRRSILTARHCVSSFVVGEALQYAIASDITPGFHPGPGLRGALVSALDDLHDLALLYAVIPPQGHGIATVREAPIEAGMFVQTMGHPLGLWFSYSSGDVAAIRQRDLGDGKLLTWVQCTTPISRGNSGGALFDEDTQIVGLAEAIVDDGANIGLFTHAMYIRRFLAEQPAF